jgi:hypothetical protein
LRESGAWGFLEASLDAVNQLSRFIMRMDPLQIQLGKDTKHTEGITKSRQSCYGYPDYEHLVLYYENSYQY